MFSLIHGLLFSSSKAIIVGSASVWWFDIKTTLVALQWHTLVLFWIRTFGTMYYKNEYPRTRTVTTSCLVLQVVTKLTKCIRIYGFQSMMRTNCQHTFFSQTWEYWVTMERRRGWRAGMERRRHTGGGWRRWGWEGGVRAVGEAGGWRLGGEICGWASAEQVETIEGRSHVEIQMGESRPS